MAFPWKRSRTGTGYVLQLARPFYEELTVRDNLTLAAEIKLPVSSKFTTKEKFKRVMEVVRWRNELWICGGDEIMGVGKKDLQRGCVIICDVFGKTNQLVRKTIFFLRRAKMPQSEFEANPTQ